MVKGLTDYADCAGCASKLPASDLALVLRDLPRQNDPDGRVLVDYRTADDAGVYRWASGPALVQTVDFFTPIVDDPYTFGQIAAANALSDVYAMGGTPRTALAIAAFPKNGPTADIIRSIFKGGSDVLGEAGVALLGGHTVTDPEIKFGYAVTGEVDPARMLTNAGAKPGDTLLLTKALGTGVLVRARKFNRATDAELEPAVRSMCQLNRASSDAIRSVASGTIRACTDVTGFGLAGHASEMAEASGVTLVIDARNVPLLPEAARLAPENLPCGGRSNAKHFGRMTVSPSVDPAVHLLCLDPQTSGGLLMSVNPDSAAAVLEMLIAAGVEVSAIGHVAPRDTDGVLVRLE